MADDAPPQAEEPQASTEPNVDAADETTIPQPRPTAWVTGGGALTYARPVPDADVASADAAAIPQP